MYQITLTTQELYTLAWLTDRGYFPESVYDALTMADNQEEKANPIVWELKEHEAWPLIEEQEQESFLTCAGPEVVEKVLNLIESIV